MAKEKLPIDQAEIAVTELQPEANTGLVQAEAFIATWFQEGDFSDPSERARKIIAGNQIRNWQTTIAPYLPEPLLSFERYVQQLRSRGITTTTLRSPTVSFAFPGDDAQLPLDTYREMMIIDKATRLPFMQALDTGIGKSSEKTITDIREAEKQKKTYQCDALIVGASITASIVTSALGPARHKLVVSNQRTPGDAWLRPIYGNSSAQRRSGNSPDLPLVDGTTTRVIPSRMQRGVKLDQITPNTFDNRQVLCDNGKTDFIFSGDQLALTIKANLAAEAESFLSDASVLFDSIRPTDRGTVLVTIIGPDRLLHTVEARSVYICTGPGDEGCQLPNVQSRADYRGSTESIREQIEEARVYLSKKGDPKKISFTLPRILSLSLVEQLYQFWKKDLNADPDLYPLKPLFDPSVSIGYVGEGDSFRSVFQFTGGNGPISAYPEGFLDNPNYGVADRTLYGMQSESIDRQERRLYQNLTATRGLRAGGRPKNSGKKGRAIAVRNIYDANEDSIGTSVAYETEDGSTTVAMHDYTFICTGIKPTITERSFRYPVSLMQDIGGQNIGRRVEVPGGADVIICGPANNFNRNEFPKWIQTLLNIFDAPNTLANWAWANLTERQIYKQMIEKPELVNRAHIQNIEAYVDQNGGLNNFRIK